MGRFGSICADRRKTLVRNENNSAASGEAAGTQLSNQRINAATAPPSYSPLLLVLAAAILWSTGGLFIKWTSLSGLELSFGRSLCAAITVALFTRREGFGLNRVTALASLLYAALLLLFVLATKETTAANAIFLQYTAPVYLL